jgi:flavin-dependent dehydrogenase
MYDAIIVGTRAAGASTAMLLARQGYRVLAVDQATFPSDTLSTHQVQVPGVAKLKHWGLLEAVTASNAPATRHVRFDAGPVVLEGQFPSFDGADALYSPRRSVLDGILVDAARAAGAEVRERFTAEELTFVDGRVTGIRGRERHRGASAVTESAALVIGADGKRSIVAETTGAETYHARAKLTLAFYTYWEGVPLSGGEMYRRERRTIGAWPTNDGLVMTYAAWPAAEFQVFRSDLEGNLLRTLDLAGDLGERVRSGRRAAPIRGTIDLPNFFRKPFGPGWALVGDAGLVMDPITGQGIGHAFRQAELLAEAIDAGLSGREPLEASLASFQLQRDHETLPMYDFTTDLASLRPPRAEERSLLASLAGKQAETDRFLGVLTGAVPITDYFRPGNLFKIMGAGGMARVVLARLCPSRGSVAAA